MDINLYNATLKLLKQNLAILHEYTLRDINNQFALIKDMAGFNASHAAIGKELVNSEIWTKKDIETAYRLVNFYKKQLSITHLTDLLPSLDEILNNVPEELNKSIRRILTVDKGTGNDFVFQFSYDNALINKLKNEVLTRYYDVMTKTWRVRNINTEKVKNIAKFCSENDFLITPSAQFLLDSFNSTDNNVSEIKAPTINGNISLIDYFQQGKAIFVTFNFSHEILEKIHDINVPKKFVTIYSVKGWVFKLSNLEELEGNFNKNSYSTFINKIRKISSEHNLIISEEVLKLFEEHYNDNDVNIFKQPDITLDASLIERVLRPFQEIGVKFILERKNVLLGDTVGTGKTIQAIASIVNSKVQKSLIIVPNTLKYNWNNEWAMTSLNHFVTMIQSKDKAEKINWDSDVIIINYDLITKHFDKLASLPFEFIVLDESHYIKNEKSLRTKAIIKLINIVKPEYRLLMSGTPITNRPKELVPQLKAINQFKKFATKDIYFLKRYCGAVQTSFGLNSDGATNLDELYQKLIQTCYLRRETEQVLKDLPEKQRNICYIDIDNRSEYNHAESDLMNYLKEWKSYDNKKLGKVQQAEHLVKIEHLKQILAKGKLKQSIQWIKDFLETGEKLVVFIHHKEIAQALKEEFPEALCILGGSSLIDKNDAVNEFQNNPDKKLIICSKTGKEGLTLTASSNLLFIELWWTPTDHDQAEGRIYRISQKNNCNFYYILGKDTIEETDIYPLIESKRAIFNQVARGMAEDDMQVDIMDELIKKWMV